MSDHVRCMFCGDESEMGKDNCFVVDFAQSSRPALCMRCVIDAARIVNKWMTGNIEYESWAKRPS